MDLGIAGGEDLADVLRRGWASKIKPLDLLAIFSVEELELLLSLHPFSKHLYV